MNKLIAKDQRVGVCQGCYFYTGICTAKAPYTNCTPSKRPDGRNIIWVVPK